MLTDRSERTALIQISVSFHSMIFIPLTESLLCVHTIAEPLFRHPAEPYLDVLNPAIRTMSYATLYKEAIIATSALRALGVQPGDRVASYSSHCIVRLPFPFSSAFSIPPATYNHTLIPLLWRSVDHYIIKYTSRLLIHLTSADFPLPLPKIGKCHSRSSYKCIGRYMD